MRKHWKVATAMSAVAMIAAVVVACSDDLVGPGDLPVTPRPALSIVQPIPSFLGGDSVYVGGTLTLTVSIPQTATVLGEIEDARPRASSAGLAALPAPTVTWTSMATALATVTASTPTGETGVVTGIQEGLVDIVATINTPSYTPIGKSGKYRVSWTATTERFPIRVLRLPVVLRFLQEADTIPIGYTQRYTAVMSEITGEPLSTTPVSYRSLDPAILSVAKVDTAAVVTGLAAGTGRVEVNYRSGYDTLAVRVLSFDRMAIVLPTGRDTLLVGDSVLVTAKFYLDSTEVQVDPESGPVVWSTLDPDIVEIRSAGQTTAWVKALSCQCETALEASAAARMRLATGRPRIEPFARLTSESGIVWYKQDAATGQVRQVTEADRLAFDRQVAGFLGS